MLLPFSAKKWPQGQKKIKSDFVLTERLPKEIYRQRSVKHDVIKRPQVITIHKHFIELFHKDLLGGAIRHVRLIKLCHLTN